MINNLVDNVRILKGKAQLRYGAQDLDMFVPEFWAASALDILVENMVASRLVYRDYQNELANYGDIVNVQQPANFTAVRKVDDDEVTVQDATSRNVQVPLNQHVHTSFIIRDGERSKSLIDLVNLFVRPAMIAQARFIDQLVLYQWPQFLANAAGGAGLLTSSTAKDYMLDLRKELNDSKCPQGPRNLILNSKTEMTLLKVSDFTLSYAISGDQESDALRRASLGMLLGMQTYLDQNMPVVATGNTTSSGAVNNAAGYPAGTTTMTVDGITGAVVTGKWFTVATEGVPHRVTAHTETLGNTTSITFTPPLTAAVLDNAVLAFYTLGEVNNASGYAVKYAKTITVDGFTVAPQVGQVVVFENSPSTMYTIIGTPTTTSIQLDRPLEAALVDNEDVYIGPAGDFNLCIHPNAIALVVRPLAMPQQGTGALSAVMQSDGVAMRSTITYDGRKQGHLVTLDFLCGIVTLDANLGGVLIG